MAGYIMIDLEITDPEGFKESRAFPNSQKRGKLTF